MKLLYGQSTCAGAKVGSKLAVGGKRRDGVFQPPHLPAPRYHSHRYSPYCTRCCCCCCIERMLTRTERRSVTTTAIQALLRVMLRQRKYQYKLLLLLQAVAAAAAAAAVVRDFNGIIVNKRCGVVAAVGAKYMCGCEGRLKAGCGGRRRDGIFFFLTTSSVGGKRRNGIFQTSSPSASISFTSL